MSDSEARDVANWKEIARNNQQQYFELLGDRRWDFIKYSERIVLMRKVAYALYGPPKIIIDNNQNTSSGYNKEQCERIKFLCDKVVEQGRFRKNKFDVWLACIFILGKRNAERFTIPVFRVLKYNKEGIEHHSFIDCSGRVYDGWEDYLNKNQLPQCIYCYPHVGIYTGDETGKVLVEFGTSPACKLGNKVWSFLDASSAIVSVGSIAVGLASLAIPVAGPFIAASTVSGIATGVYGAGRSTYTLIDRGTHGQSIGLDDSEARNCWLGIVGSTLGVASGQAVKTAAKMAKSGYIMGKATHVAMTALGVGSLTVNAFAVVNGLVIIVDKAERDELTALDVFQFTSSVLFFTNSVISLKTANGIIKDCQNNTIKNCKKVSTPAPQKGIFEKRFMDIGDSTLMRGSRRVIKGIRTFHNSIDFISSFVDLIEDPDLTLTGSGPAELETDPAELSTGLRIHRLTCYEINSDFHEQILKALENVTGNNRKIVRFKQDVRNICKTNQNLVECQRNESIRKLCNAFDGKCLNDIDIGGRKIFRDIHPHEVDRLTYILMNTYETYHEQLIAIGSEFARLQRCRNSVDYFTCLEFACAYLAKKRKKLEQEYQENLDFCSTLENVDMIEFDWNYGTEEERDQFLNEAVLAEFITDQGFNENSFRKMESQFFDLRESARWRKHVGPKKDNETTYYYYKYFGLANKENLTIRQSFDLASKLTGQQLNESNSFLFEEGKYVFIVLEDVKSQIRGALVERYVKDGCICGIAALFFDSDIKQ